MCTLAIPQGDAARQLPSFPIPADFGSTDEYAYFEQIAWEGFEDRMATDWQPLIDAKALKYGLDVYRERLAREIDTIKGMGFPGYFLIVWDFIRYAREQNIPVGPGRGSAAGSLVAYCLRITDVDPIEHELLFERFLNPERISMPDIDIDFCIRGRGAVIEHVTRALRPRFRLSDRDVRDDGVTCGGQGRWSRARYVRRRGRTRRKTVAASTARTEYQH